MKDHDIVDALVEDERASLVRPVDATAATWSRIAASIKDGHMPPIPPPPVGSIGATGGVSKIAVLAIVLGTGVGLVVARQTARHASDPTPTRTGDTEPAPVTAPRGDEPAAIAPPRTDPHAEPIDAATIIAEHEADEPSPVARRSSRRAVEPDRSVTEPSPTATRSTLAAESRLIARAKAAMSGSEPESALAILREHERDHPDGQLTEDRLALQALAACAAGRTAQGQRALAELRRRFPKTSHGARVGSACGDAN